MLKRRQNEQVKTTLNYGKSTLAFTLSDWLVDRGLFTATLFFQRKERTREEQRTKRARSEGLRSKKKIIKNN